MTRITQAHLERARDQEYGETIEYNRTGKVDLPPSVERSSFPQSLPLGAEAVYREDRPTDSVQIRIYEDKVTLQLDRFNPEYRPVGHAVADATTYTITALGLVWAASSGG